MSMDYPDYLLIREKSRVLGWIWRIGDCGYYLGLLAAMISLSAAVVETLLPLLGGPERDPLTWWICFPFFVAVFFLSVRFKRFARRGAGIA